MKSIDSTHPSIDRGPVRPPSVASERNDHEQKATAIHRWRISSWLLFLFTHTMTNIAANAGDTLTSHIRTHQDLGDLRGVSATVESDSIHLRSAPVKSNAVTSGPAFRYSWATIPAPLSGWDLGKRASVSAVITNNSPEAIQLIFWVVGDSGWDAVPDSATVEPGTAREFSCNLRERYPDGTPKVDPHRIKQIQIMISGVPRAPIDLTVRSVQALGQADSWQRPPHRLNVPPIEDGVPEAGRRVRYRLDRDKDSPVFSILNLPENWQPSVTYPVIVEFPGNIFFVPGCYSTGLPEQCIIGYGMTKGRDAICVSLPFVDREHGRLAESGWGNPDDTVDYALQMVDVVCTRFGGDRQNLILTGFSRGALACGYIGLRNERIAALWKGFHACQHYDGDGWNGATLEGALERATRFRGKAIFQTDNSPEKFGAVMTATKAQVTWAKSELGAHATAMFLDDRPSTVLLRNWYRELVGLR